MSPRFPSSKQAELTTSMQTTETAIDLKDHQEIIAPKKIVSSASDNMCEK
jgi:hypothetical protein